MTTNRPGLRERKKQATREALREAALRLALERGPDDVRVEEIAEAAGVSPRTYNNYFSSREQAIVAAVTAERESRVAAAVSARPPDVRLTDAVAEAIVEQYTDAGASSRDALLLITTSDALRAAFTGTTAAMERPLAGAIARRLGFVDERTAEDEHAAADGESTDAAGTFTVAVDADGADETAGAAYEHTARVLAAAVTAAVRIALEQWVQPVKGSRTTGLVVVSGSLPDLLRAALEPLTPALDAAERQAHVRRAPTGGR